MLRPKYHIISTMVGKKEIIVIVKFTHVTIKYNKIVDKSLVDKKLLLDKDYYLDKEFIFKLRINYKSIYSKNKVYVLQSYIYIAV